jgi:hypothetical protein
VEEDMSECWLGTQEGRGRIVGELDDGDLIYGRPFHFFGGHRCDKMIPYTENLVAPSCVEVAAFQ